MIEFISRAVLIGVGATALLDLWALLLQRFFKVPAPNWGLVGRWFCHLTDARVFHNGISLARAYPFENAVGWIGHYAIGIVYAGALLVFTRPDWASAPTLAPALAVGIITVGAGWFLLQPGTGRASLRRNILTRNRSGRSILPTISSSVLGCMSAHPLSGNFLARRCHRTIS
jgi:hypothetical protein